MSREDHEATLRNVGTTFSQTGFGAKSLMPPPKNMGEALRLMKGDYTHGHPGVPPKGYKQPREGGIFGRYS